MFFSAENFTALPNKKDREIAADTANEVIMQQGVLLYGMMMSDGTAQDFTTDKAPTDSHTCIAIAMSLMHAFAPADSHIASKDQRELRITESQKLYISQLEREVKSLRGSGNA